MMDLPHAPTAAEREPGPATAGASPCARGCLEVLARCVKVLGVVEASGDAELLERIGPHLRHILDHFTCLFAGLTAGRIDYDERARDPRLERDPAVMRSALTDATQRLARLPASRGAATITVVTRVCTDATVPMASTVDRELAFVSAHTVHHLSIVTQIVRNHGVDVDPALELAFSTAEYRSRQRRGAS